MGGKFWASLMVGVVWGQRHTSGVWGGAQRGGRAAVGAGDHNM
jgi:hypothetical protein